MATQLGVINESLSMLGDSEIASVELIGLTNERARVMASAWPDAVDECLSSAAWRFASFIVGIAPQGLTIDEQRSYAAPGYSRAFAVPEDHLRTNWLRNTPYGDSQPIRFHYQDGYWHSDVPSLYVSYVSHTFRPPENWTPLFATMVSSYLAWKRGPRLRPSADANELRLKFEAMEDRAKTQDASETPFAWASTGRLVRSRGGYRDGDRNYGGRY